MSLLSALAWRSACVASLLLQMLLLLWHHRVRPISTISLSDLIHVDLCSTYVSTILFIFLIQSLEVAHAQLPSLLSGFITFSFYVSISAFLIYLTTSVVVQFLHCYRKQASLLLSERHLTDVETQLAIRAVVVTAAVALQLLMLLIGGTSPVYYMMMAKTEDNMVASPVKGAVVMTLGLATTAVNLVLRLYMAAQRWKTDRVLLPQGQDYIKTKKRLLLHLAISLMIVVPLSFTVIAVNSSDSTLNKDLTRNVTFLMLTVFVPLGTNLSNVRLRLWVWANFKRLIRCSARNKVVPLTI